MTQGELAFKYEEINCCVFVARGHMLCYIHNSALNPCVESIEERA